MSAARRAARRTEESRLCLALDMITLGARGRRVPRPLRRVADEALAASTSWRRDAGIVGFGAAHRCSAGERLQDWALKVYVERKLPRGRLTCPVPPLLYLPDLEQPVAVDVEPIGRPLAQGRIVRAGTAILGSTGAAGSLGGIVRGDGEYYLLGNAHVLGFDGIARPGQDGVFEWDRVSGNAVERLGSFQRAAPLDVSGQPTNEDERPLRRVTPVSGVGDIIASSAWLGWHGAR